jgi:hypothetical protein
MQTHTSKYSIGASVCDTRSPYTEFEVVSVRFTNTKVLYNLLNRSLGKIDKNVDESWLADKTEPDGAA